jgi:adenylate cyclase
MSGRARLRTALFLAVGLAATGVGLLAYGTNVFRGLELSSVDFRFSVRGKQDPPKDVVVVAIDARTFNDLQEQWPFPRGTYHGRVIRRLHDAGAKVIAYDVQFTEPSDEPQDNKLIDAVAYARGVVLATTEVDEFGRGNVFGGNVPPGSEIGDALIKPDPGDVLRRLPYAVQGLTAFSVVAAELWSGHGIRPFAKDRWIDYAGPPGTIPTVSFSNVWLGKVPESFFRGKVVVVGPAAPSLQDVHPTPFGENMSGAEIQANAISTVLRDFPLKSVPNWVTVALIVLFGMGPALAGLRGRLSWTLAVSLGLAIFWLVGTQFSFNLGWVLTFVYPFMTLALSSVGALGAHYLLAAFEHERVRDVFSRFVPEAVVEQVLARTDRDLRLGGVSLESTVMFSDLRGFTTFAETLPPARVIECLNGYLEEMTNAILGHGGTLVSYEGDGIMAVFGAPIEQPDHADRAVAAAREMLTERLPRWNRWLRDNELSDGFKMGIGLSTGMVVSGNVGSERRLEYTAIGDTTNTASRLQGMTKGQSYLLYFADTTRERLQQDPDDLVFIDELEVRGRQQPVKIWSIEAASDAPAQGALAR